MQDKPDKKTEARFLAEIKQFVNSDAWKKYALPMINQSVQKELPKPTEENWQEKYIYAHALANAFSMVINALQNMAGRKDFEKRIEKFLKGSIDEA